MDRGKRGQLLALWLGQADAVTRQAIERRSAARLSLQSDFKRLVFAALFGGDCLVKPDLLRGLDSAWIE
jgi:hypothetical protein